MRFRIRSCVVWLGILFLSACSGDSPVQTYSTAALDAAKAELRDHARLRSFEAGLHLAEEWVVRAPGDAELRALYARQLAAWRSWNEAHVQAEAILSEDPGNPWGLYARAVAILAEGGRGEEADRAIEASRRAWEALERPEVAATHAAALRQRGAEPALAFLDGLDSATARAPEVLHARAETEYWAQHELDDPSWADTSLATLAELRERWPDHVDGYVRAAESLFRANRADEALPLIEEAVRLSPGSVDVRQWHWWILWESDVLPAGERRPAVEASIAAFREAAPESVRGLAAMASIYRDMDDAERAEELEARVLSLAPESRHATRIHAREYQAARSKLNEIYREHGKDSPEYREQLPVVRDAVTRFLERPLYDDRYRSSAYVTLYMALRDTDPVPAEELAETVRGLAEHERLNPHISFAMAPISMAEHTPYAEEAAAIARQGVQVALDHLEAMKGIYETEGEYEEAQRYHLGLIHDAMGWAYFQAGRIEDARHTLERALAIEPRNRDAHHHLGRLFEHRAAGAEAAGDEEAAREWLDRAEDAYIAGLGISRPGENPNEAALEALYERRHGSRDGLEEYLATLHERDRIRRKERILEERPEGAGTYEPFDLPRLDGRRIASDELEGKIAVLHFWGTWCGPCIWENPRYQEFDERYRDDPEVVVLAISNDNSREVVEEYMQRNGFDFTVLMDDGYVQRAGVSAWPTTWFVDRDGLVRFVKQGASEHPEEEFAWRVEALREEGRAR